MTASFVKKIFFENTKFRVLKLPKTPRKMKVKALPVILNLCVEFSYRAHALEQE